jgi:hypothetical protein
MSWKIKKASSKKVYGYRPKPYKGLTDYEKKKVASTLQADKLRWEHLFSLNKWTPNTTA